MSRPRVPRLPWGGVKSRWGAESHGGHSFGIAHSGAAPTQDGVTITIGSEGDGGPGGDGGSGNQGGPGDAGQSTEVLSFD